MTEDSIKFESVDIVLQKADLIVQDYAFICIDASHILAISLMNLTHRGVFDDSLKLLVNSFDDIEAVLVTKLLTANLKYLEG